MYSLVLKGTIGKKSDHQVNIQDDVKKIQNLGLSLTSMTSVNATFAKAQKRGHLH